MSMSPRVLLILKFVSEIEDVCVVLQPSRMAVCSMLLNITFDQSELEVHPVIDELELLRSRDELVVADLHNLVESVIDVHFRQLSMCRGLYYRRCK